jgi:hypothetical protein
MVHVGLGSVLDKPWSLRQEKKRSSETEGLDLGEGPTLRASSPTEVQPGPPTRRA